MGDQGIVRAHAKANDCFSRSPLIGLSAAIATSCFKQNPVMHRSGRLPQGRRSSTDRRRHRRSRCRSNREVWRAPEGRSCASAQRRSRSRSGQQLCADFSFLYQARQKFGRARHLSCFDRRVACWRLGTVARLRGQGIPRRRAEPARGADLNHGARVASRLGKHAGCSAGHPSREHHIDDVAVLVIRRRRRPLRPGLSGGNGVPRGEMGPPTAACSPVDAQPELELCRACAAAEAARSSMG